MLCLTKKLSPVSSKYLTHGVLANDIDPIPNDTLTVSAVNGQAANVGHAVAGTYGTLTLNADGSYSYSANGSHALPSSGVAEDIFTYTAEEARDLAEAHRDDRKVVPAQAQNGQPQEKARRGGDGGGQGEGREEQGSAVPQGVGDGGDGERME